MTRPQGSIARTSFDDALTVVRTTPLGSPRQHPAFDLVVPRSAAPATPVTPDPDAPVPVPDGPVQDAADAMAAGRVTSRELVERSFAAIDEYDAELVGMADHDIEAALAAADALDAERRAGEVRSRLHGIPITVKDVIDVAGLTTRAGSLTYADRPAHDAEAVGRLRRAGVVVIGKAATHEFALGVTSPQCRNPHDPTRLAGGSSGGSAVAVATGMGLASLGTDTRASIRVPAALCGLVGLKPTYGRVPTAGIVTLSWTMDHAAPMAATVADAATMLDSLGPAPGPGGWLGHAAAIDTSRLRVGTVGVAFDEADPEVAALVEAAVTALGNTGTTIAPAERPHSGDLDVANAAGLLVSRCEASTQHRSFGLDRALYWEEVAEQLEQAESIVALDYLQAQRLRQDLSESLMAEFRSHDLLAMPTVPVLAPPVEDFAAYLMRLARTAIPWSFVGFPAITVPCGWVGSLPVGLQLVAPPGREDLLVAVGQLVERLTMP
jgi:Asp-tRNA(Asn)/Glu-tRNA(Gln) amidotransferase A subunit family amidase